MNHPSSLSVVLQDNALTSDVMTGTLAPSAFRRAVDAWSGDSHIRTLPSSALLLIRVDWAQRPARHDAAEDLRTVAELIGRHTHRSDVVGRVDHETIGVLMPTTPLFQAEIVSRRMLASVAGRTAGAGRPLTVSIGITSAAVDAPLRRAHGALLDARELGGDHAVVCHEEAGVPVRRAA